MHNPIPKQTINLTSNQPKESHVVNASTLARYQYIVYRIVAGGLIAISLTGNVLAFGGLAASAIVLAILWQIICTGLQMMFCNNVYNPLYLAPLIASVSPSFLGYLPLLNQWLYAHGDPSLALPLRIALLFFVTAIDILPERILIRH